MALRIRLARAGAKKRPFYRIVVADSASPRDGRFIERVGTYNPLLPKDHEDRVKLKTERIQEWLAHGATPSQRVARFLGAAEVIPAPPQPYNPQKAQPKAKAQERMKEREEARQAAEETAAEPEEAPAEETAAAEAGEAPAEEPPAEAEAAAEETSAEAETKGGEAEAEAAAEEAPAEETSAEAEGEGGEEAKEEEKTE